MVFHEEIVQRYSKADVSPNLYPKMIFDFKTSCKVFDQFQFVIGLSHTHSNCGD